MKPVEQKIVVSKVFKLYDTNGIPLSIIFDYLKSQDLVIAWDYFIKEAKLAGWPKKKILSTWQEAIQDSYGQDYLKMSISKFKYYLEGRKK
jgi:alanyl-tRNA synthetase